MPRPRVRRLHAGKVAARVVVHGLEPLAQQRTAFDRADDFHQRDACRQRFTQVRIQPRAARELAVRPRDKRRTHKPARQHKIDFAGGDREQAERRMRERIGGKRHADRNVERQRQRFGARQVPARLHDARENTRDFLPAQFQVRHDDRDARIVDQLLRRRLRMRRFQPRARPLRSGLKLVARRGAGDTDGRRIFFARPALRDFDTDGTAGTEKLRGLRRHDVECVDNEQTRLGKRRGVK